MRPSHLLGLLLAPALLAQSQPTFYEAYQDGLDAEHHQDWSAAASAYRRAIELRPAPAARVIIYGNNLLTHYYPYTRLARCELELGHLDAVRPLLNKALFQGEPPAERLAEEHRLEALQARLQTPRPASPPIAVTAPPRSTPPPPLESAQPAPPAASAALSPVDPSTTPPPAGPNSVTPPQAPGSLSLAPARVAPTSTQVPPSTPFVRSSPPAAGPSRRWAWALGGLTALLSGLFWVRLGRKRQAALVGFREPERLGPYRIERLLGRGGFASTYLAQNDSTGTTVALKVLHPFRQDDPEFLSRFRQEARLGTLLDHPNLVRILDPGPEEGTPYLAMEYVPGKRLDQLLRESGPLPLRELLRLACPIAAGLAHAHRHGIIHRDLKPGNVMIHGERVKVMDFGISRVVDSVTLTTTYAFLGTPLYAAPEAQLKTQNGPSADRYSFGIMLFEMLTGRPPFVGETPFEILDQHRTSPLPDPAALCPDAPTPLVDLIKGLCRKDPGQRPQDEDIMAVLKALSSAP